MTCHLYYVKKSLYVQDNVLRISNNTAVGLHFLNASFDFIEIHLGTSEPSPLEMCPRSLIQLRKLRTLTLNFKAKAEWTLQFSKGQGELALLFILSGVTEVTDRIRNSSANSIFNQNASRILDSGRAARVQRKEDGTGHRALQPSRSDSRSTQFTLVKILLSTSAGSCHWGREEERSCPGTVLAAAGGEKQRLKEKNSPRRTPRGLRTSATLGHNPRIFLTWVCANGFFRKDQTHENVHKNGKRIQLRLIQSYTKKKKEEGSKITQENIVMKQMTPGPKYMAMNF